MKFDVHKWETEKMTNKNKKRVYTNKATQRRPTQAITHDIEKYGRLSAEIELQKLLVENNQLTEAKL